MHGRLIGKYRIIRKLGEGGMGVLYEAHNEALDKRVAIKMLRPHLSEDREVAQRLVKEARSAARIRHSGIVDVLDVDEQDDGQLYILMEYLDGMSLAERLARDELLDEDTAVSLAAQIADALAAAHEAGVVHRDLKPDNIFLVPDPLVSGGERVKLLDFGIAKRMETEGSLETKVGVLLGTPPYMSPEQCRGERNVDHRSDLYALGVILFEMVCGRRPFQKPSAMGYLRAHDSEQPPAAHEVNPDVSPRLSAIIARLLEKDQDRRFQTAREMLEALSSSAPLAPRVAAPAAPAMQSARGKRRSRVAPTVVVGSGAPMPSSPANAVAGSLAGRPALPQLPAAPDLPATAADSGAPRTATTSLLPGARVPSRLPGAPNIRPVAVPAPPRLPEPRPDALAIPRASSEADTVPNATEIVAGEHARADSDPTALSPAPLPEPERARPDRTAFSPLDTIEELPGEAVGSAPLVSIGERERRGRRWLRVALAGIALAAAGVAIGVFGGGWPDAPTLGRGRTVPAGAASEISGQLERAPASLASDETDRPNPAPRSRRKPDVSKIHKIRDVVRAIQRGDRDLAIAGIHKLRPAHKRSAYLPFLLGNLHCERLEWSQAIAAYREAIKKNRVYRKKDIVIRNAIRALAHPDSRDAARALLKNSIGAVALPELREAADSGEPIVSREAARLVELLDDE